MTKTIRLKAEETAIIYRRNFSSVPMDIRFEAVSLDGGTPSGTVTIRGSDWVFPKSAITQPLSPQNRVHAGFWDTFFSIEVTAHGDIDIISPGQRVELNRWLIWAIVGIVIVAVLIAFIGQ